MIIADGSPIWNRFVPARTELIPDVTRTPSSTCCIVMTPLMGALTFEETMRSLVPSPDVSISFSMISSSSLARLYVFWTISAAFTASSTSLTLMRAVFASSRLRFNSFCACSRFIRFRSTAKRFWNSTSVWVGSGSIIQSTCPFFTLSPSFIIIFSILPAILDLTSSVLTSSILPVSVSFSTTLPIRTLFVLISSTFLPLLIFLTIINPIITMKTRMMRGFFKRDFRLLPFFLSIYCSFQRLNIPC